MDCRTYTTAAHSPRRGFISASAPLDVSYSVFTSAERSASAYSPTSSTNPTISFVFCHGSQLNKELWNWYVEQLFKHYGSRINVIITIDAVNSGESARLNEGRVGFYHEWQDLAKDNILVIKDVIRRQGPIGPLIAVGHSMGGCEVLFMANLEPSLLKGIVTMDPVWGPNDLFSHEEAKKAMKVLAFKVNRNIRREFDSLDEYFEWMRKKFITRSFHPQLRDDVLNNYWFKRGDKYLIKPMAELSAGAYASAASMVHHSVSTLKYTPVQTLVIHGNIDDWNPPGNNEELVKALPFAEEAVVQGGGHVVFFEKPAETLEKMIPFFDKIIAQSDTPAPQFDVASVQESFKKYTKL